MFVIAEIGWLHYLFTIPLAILSVFLILVILVQRGRGGGLTGALGGMGGQSAFGTKAGDLFTRITIVVAAIWVLLSMAALKVLNEASATAGFNPNARGVSTAPQTPTTKGGSLTTPPADPVPPTATSPAATPEAPPPAADSAGKPDSAAKPSDAAKPADAAKE